MQSAVFPAEYQPNISSAEYQPKKNSASRISAEKKVSWSLGIKKFGSGVYDRLQYGAKYCGKFNHLSRVKCAIVTDRRHSEVLCQ